MSVMSAEVYDALREAGASEDKSRKAAEAVAGLDAQHRESRGEFSVVKWMLGTNITLTLLILGRLFLR